MEESKLKSLRSRLHGELVLPGEEGYEAGRRIYNAAIDRRPRVIVRCAGPSDVMRSVEFAREHGLIVSVRGGGHGVAGKAVCEGGMMIDLSRMKAVRVHPDERRAWAEPGATYRDFDHETTAFGLATTGGTVSATGIAGLTLGGGLGWLMRKYGLACDNLSGADVVTAEGHLVRATAKRNPDLLWGLRGGGGNFGIVTCFEYKLHPVETLVGGMLVHPVSKARELWRFQRQFLEELHEDDLTVFSALLYPAPEQPAVVQVLGHLGTADQAAQDLAPLRKWGPPLADTIAPMHYCQLQQVLDAGFPNGMHNYWTANFVQTLSDEVIDIMAEHFERAPNSHSVVVVEQMGGAVRRVRPEDTAFPMRDGDYNVAIVARWQQAGEAEKCVAWAKSLHRALAPHSADAAYVNYLPEEEGERMRSIYGEARYRKLAALKKKYDPENLFRMNHNVRPE